MTTKLIALASAVAAAIAFAPVAEAAGGVRLGFGGPLGTFTATPSKGAGSKSASRSKKTHVARQHVTRKERHAPTVRQAARKPESESVRPARIPRESARIDAVRDTPREAPKPKIAKAHVETEEVAPRTGSTALIHTAIPEKDTGHDGTEDGTAAGTADGTPAGREAAADVSETTEHTATCTKFIPAVGMTVTVGCEE